ncbi:MAG: hypothetical protein H0W07_00640 [Chloroflexi bacterium]|nr:hypothetical protein [Chloroflexota bacterium]
MAAGVSRLRPRIGLAVMLATLVAPAAAGCVPDNRAAPPRNDDPAVVNPVLPTPQRSPSAQIAATARLVENALVQKGLRVAQAIGPYRPSEPAGLTTAPRAIYQVDLGVADTGYIVIYELLDPTAAGERGREFAAYLGKGFGQTNFPLDAQFALSQSGATLIFTWWSPSRAPDDGQARTAFDTVATIGQPVPVTK